MTLDRWIALGFLALCCVYGYAAWFTMDQLLPPFMQRNPIWPSTFPKVLSVMGALAALAVLINLEKVEGERETPEIDHRRLLEYNYGQALALLALMVLYALALRPIGFLLSTSGFLIAGAAVLGERRWVVLIPVAAGAALIVWWLVEEVLGIFLRPLPWFL